MVSAKRPLDRREKGEKFERGEVPKAAMGVNRNCLRCNCLRLSNTGTQGAWKYLAGV